MSKGTLFDKVWDLHTVGTLASGQTQLFIGLHLIHEVTSPQAFAMLRERGLKVLFPNRTVATVDHIVPTENQARPFVDTLAEEMMQALETNCKENGITFYNIGTGNQGIVHVIAPEQGLTQPGMTIACGDSHTSTHGAFGAIAFGIGTSQVRDVLASQTLALSKLKVRKIEVNGTLKPGVYAKDVVLHIIRTLGVKGGVGYAYEFAGTTFEQMSMEERMTVCNMSIEGGARCGYVNPDKVTYEYLKGKDFAPKGEDWDKAIAWWESLRSDADAEYDDVVVFDATDIPPTVTWGITPGQGIGVNQTVPRPEELPADDRVIAQEAYSYMDLAPGNPIEG
ncbi:MAG: 3-isopropylmalate dehydratase large subunit, partial [Cyanobacteriota bacterium]|nr:3-isopropylmalate dehydratase large subunit [Cyanobacteriota bacterium]